MGMSASQVRYCMLQSRKSDIEFQGQQINQQRTTLATQSAAYNTEMLTMAVPTPPSTEEYTTTTYSFSLNGADCDIKATNYMNQNYTVDGKEYKAGTYVIDYTTKETKNVASRGSKYGVEVKYTETGLWGDPDDAAAGDQNKDDNFDVYVMLNGQAYLLTLATPKEREDLPQSELTVEDLTHRNDVSIIKQDFADDLDDEEEKEFLVAEIAPGKYEYFLKEDIQEYLLQKEDQMAVSPVQSYNVSAQSVDVNKRLYGATINWTDTGRMSSISDSKGRLCGLDVNTVADDRAYTDAYNEYLYQKDQYNKKMEDINSKLEVIQAQDKKLELQLRNLDTQETAIKTEMDAVKSVCQANIEKSFNVFG